MIRPSLRTITATVLLTGGLFSIGCAAVPAQASTLNIVDNGDGTATGFWSVPASTWPQPVIAATALCGLVQADQYPYASDADKTRTNALPADGQLTEGEDYGWAISWTVKDYGPCQTAPSSTDSETSTPAPTPSATAPVSETPSPSPTDTAPTTPTETSSAPSTPTDAPTSPPATSTPTSTPTSSSTPTSTPTAPVTSPTATATSTPTSYPTRTPIPASQPSTPGGTPAAHNSTKNDTTATEVQTGGSELAFTGSNAGPYIAVGVLLTLGGVLLLATTRKKKGTNDE